VTDEVRGLQLTEEQQHEEESKRPDGQQDSGAMVSMATQSFGEEIIAADPSFVPEGEDYEIDIHDDGGDQSPEDQRFDTIVGKLLDIMIEDDFEQKQEAFSSANCHHFEDSEENKLIYMDLFKEYTSQIETYLEQRLQEEVPGFDMEEFYEMLSTREDALVGEVFDMLLSLSDFDTFKDLMLSYKQEKANGSLLDINIRPMMLHVGDEEDGDHRPDLDDHLIVSPAGSGK